MLFEPDTAPLGPDEALDHCVRRLSNGAKRPTIRADLLARGIAPEQAAVIAEKAFILKTAAFRKKGWELLGIGGAIGLVGLFFAWTSFMSIEAGGGLILFSSGALFGGFGAAGRGAWMILTNQPIG